VKSREVKQPTFKVPPHPKAKSEAVPKVVTKAPPPKLSDGEDVGLPPPPPPEVPHPSEIPREHEVPQLKRIMTPERRTYVGTKEGQQAERKLSREPNRQRSEPLPPIPEQEVLQPSPKKAETIREESAPPPPKRPPPVCPMNEAQRAALVAETLERARRVEAKSSGGAAKSSGRAAKSSGGATQSTEATRRAEEHEKLKRNLEN